MKFVLVDVKKEILIQRWFDRHNKFLEAQKIQMSSTGKALR